MRTTHGDPATTGFYPTPPALVQQLEVLFLPPPFSLDCGPGGEPSHLPGRGHSAAPAPFTDLSSVPGRARLPVPLPATP